MTISRIGQFEVQASKGAFVLAVVLSGLSMVRLGGWNGLVGGGLIIGSLLLHELAHLATAQALGIPVKAIGLCLRGAYLHRFEAQRPWSELVISLAGPAANLCVYAYLRNGNEVGSWVALLNLVLAVSNLMPFSGSDGSRAHQAWKALRTTQQSEASQGN